ncbi:uncharacterized protein [Amphiura filiformis]|uniref:uncharacterized protein n=1 Tax=Amphiura filiformis TaxID=82378 RepID=UPI003B214338
MATPVYRHQGSFRGQFLGRASFGQFPTTRCLFYCSTSTSVNVSVSHVDMPIDAYTAPSQIMGAIGAGSSLGVKTKMAASDSDLWEVIKRLSPNDLQCLYIELGIGLKDVETWELDAGPGATVHFKARKVLAMWRQRNGKIATKKALLEALKKCRQLAVKEELEIQWELKGPDGFQQPPDYQYDLHQMSTQGEAHLNQTFFDLDICKRELCMAYEDEQGKVSLLPFESTVEIDDIFVNLELVQEAAPLDKGKEEERIRLDSYNDLFCLRKKIRTKTTCLRVLLKGGPGNGKTTLTSKIAYDWAQNIKDNIYPVLSQFELLFVLNMRYIEREMSFVDAIFSQLLPSDSKVSKEGLEKYIVENATKIGIILDGADEYRGKIVKSRSGNRIADVVCNKMLRESCTIVTTRPHMVNKVVEFYKQYCVVEVTGFSRPNVFQYVGRFFQVRPYTPSDEFYRKFVTMKKFPFTMHYDDEEEDNINESKESKEAIEESVDSFLKKIHLSESLFSLSCIPVILTMLCVLWQGSQNLPERIADLYREVVHYFIQRWYEKHSDSETLEADISNSCVGTMPFGALSEDDSNSKTLEANLSNSLGKVAFEALFEDRLYVTGNEFQEFWIKLVR